MMPLLSWRFALSTSVLLHGPSLSLHSFLSTQHGKRESQSQICVWEGWCEVRRHRLSCCGGDAWRAEAYAAERWRQSNRRRDTRDAPQRAGILHHTPHSHHDPLRQHHMPLFSSPPAPSASSTIRPPQNPIPRQPTQRQLDVRSSQRIHGRTPCKQHAQDKASRRVCVAEYCEGVCRRGSEWGCECDGGAH